VNVTNSPADTDPVLPQTSANPFAETAIRSRFIVSKQNSNSPWLSPHPNTGSYPQLTNPRATDQKGFLFSSALAKNLSPVTSSLVSLSWSRNGSFTVAPCRDPSLSLHPIHRSEVYPTHVGTLHKAACRDSPAKRVQLQHKTFGSSGRRLLPLRKEREARPSDSSGFSTGSFH
jgi:hypothetical protein